MGLTVEDGGLPVTLISDGEIDRENLDLLQKDEDWLLRELRARGLASPKQVSYMNVDELGNIFLQEKESE